METVKALNLESKLTYVYNELSVFAEFEFEYFTHEVLLRVINVNSGNNLLSVSYLMSGSYVLDLHKNQLIHRRNIFPKYLKSKTTMVSINGKEVECIVDTGTLGFMVTPLAIAKEFGVALKDVSHAGVYMVGVSDRTLMTHLSERVKFKAFGREVEGFFQVSEVDGMPIIGMQLLKDLVMSFNADSTYSITVAQQEN